VTLQHKFAAAATITVQASKKCIKKLKNVFLNSKGQGPSKLEKMSCGTMASHNKSFDTAFIPC
jgi:hypothetical protein